MQPVCSGDIRNFHQLLLPPRLHQLVLQLLFKWVFYIIDNHDKVFISPHHFSFCVYISLQAITKREITTRRGSRRKLGLQHADRRRLEASLPSYAHRGLRLLCANEASSLDIDCPVDIGAGEFACARLSNIRLDINKIQNLVEPILRKIVNPPADDAVFDEVAKPLAPLDDRIPGISDIAKVSFVCDTTSENSNLICFIIQ